MKTIAKGLIMFVMLNAGFTSAQITMNVKAFVEGFYNSSQNQMKAVVDPVNNPQLFDTITVSMVDPADLSVVYSDNVLFTTDGNAVLNMPSQLAGQSLYINVKHRSSIRTWSANPVTITNGGSYDFTNAVSSAYGGNQVWMDSASCIFTGEITNDSFIDVADWTAFDNDMQNGLFGYYIITDLNGDSAVDILDYLVLNTNIQEGVTEIAPDVVSKVEELKASVFNAFPNPAKSELTVTADQQMLSQYQIYDISGRKMEVNEIQSPVFTADVSRYPEGIYILKINDRQLRFNVVHD